MPPTSKEARVILALEAIRNDGKLSLRAVAKLYEVLDQPSVADALVYLYDATLRPI
jgi:hypothetical protein